MDKDIKAECFVSSSPDETLEVGRRIAARLSPPRLVLLIGDLGAGKTTLTKGIVEGLGAASPHDVTSPTFALMHEHGSSPKVYHLDLYRLDRIPELETLGLDELWDRSDAIVLVEWGEKFGNQLPPNRIEIRLTQLDDDRREITVAST